METQKHIDFHTHTKYSDGLGTTEDVIKAARFNGLAYLAITDHDNIRAHRNAKELGRKWGVEIVAGVEVSTDKYHILGLGIDLESNSLREFMNIAEAQQKGVCAERIANLRKQNVPITLEKVVKYTPEARLGKMNIWYAMVRDNECRDFFRREGLGDLTWEGYKDYLDKCEEKVSDEDTDISPREAIRQIHLAKGLAFVAHPFKQVKDMKELDVLVEQGLDGLEIQPTYNGQNEPFREYARQHNLLVTYGSDWHGGIFGRPMLTDGGENVLDERLAKALGINLEGKK